MTDSSSTLPTFAVRETDLVKSWGVPRSKFREMRSKNAPHAPGFLRGVDWNGDSRGVFWSEKGAAQLAADLGFQWPVSGRMPAPPAIDAESVTVVSMPIRPMNCNGVVTRFHFANRFLIKARRATGEEVYVRVPDSSKFVTHLVGGQPMTLLARLDGGLWHLAQRAPRFKGRW